MSKNERLNWKRPAFFCRCVIHRFAIGLGRGGSPRCLAMDLATWFDETMGCPRTAYSPKELRLFRENDDIPGVLWEN